MSELCFRLSRKRVLTRGQGSAGARAESFDEDGYRDWRTRELEAQFVDHFQPSSLAGKDVLDFGCGEGDLSFLVSRMDPASVQAVDVDESRVLSAKNRARSGKVSLPVEPRFWCANNTRSIDLEDSSVDRILCFDVLEHIMDFDEIIAEWRRILRPDGKILIWWVPWFHPFGPHIESLVPLPWAHIFFSEKTLLRTCARVYDMEEFKPRIWDVDDGGGKLPNKWQAMEALPGVNKLTIRQFEKSVQRVGLRVARRELHGFQSGRLRSLKDFLARLPICREFFTSFVIYELGANPK